MFDIGGNSTTPILPDVDSCSDMRRAFLHSDAGQKALDILYIYAKKNLLWLNVYVKVCCVEQLTYILVYNKYNKIILQYFNILIITTVLFFVAYWQQTKKDSFATKIVRDEKVPITSFIANVGGLLGLCMGFSLVSVVEMVYFCIKEKIFGIINAICGTNISSTPKTDNNQTANNDEMAENQNSPITSNENKNYIAEENT